MVPSLREDAGRHGYLKDQQLTCSSPDDAEAHDARKYTTQWVGDKVHLTESCEDDLPHLITHVETTSGRAADGTATPKIHGAPQQRGLLPRTHIVDTGFLAAELLVEGQAHYGVDLLGPTRRDDHWPAQAGVGIASVVDIASM